MKYKVAIKAGRKIRLLRKRQKMSQEELAEKVGLHYTTIGRIERGESNPPIQTVNKIAQVLKVPVSEIFNR